MHSLLLAPDTWDLFVDPNGKIANCYAEYAIAQNVANAIRLFTNDAYFDSDRGIPHFALELKRAPSINLLKSRIKEAALSVDGVADCGVGALNIDEETRQLSGYIKILLNNGEIYGFNL